jgi:hypothetical protein
MLKAVWKMKDNVYNKIKGMDSSELFKYVEKETSKILERVK